MARPKKLTLDFFVHSANARHDRRIKSLRRRENNDGYATYYILLEMSCSEKEMKLHLDNEIIVEDIADECGLRDIAHLYKVIESCVSVGLFNSQLWRSERIIFSDDLYNSYLDRLEDRKATAERKQRFSEAKSLQEKIDQVMQKTEVITQKTEVVTQENEVVTRDNPPEDQNYRNTELSEDQNTYTEDQNPKAEKENAKVCDTHIEADVILPEEIQLVDQALVANVQEKKETPPPTPAPFLSENIGLAIAEKPKAKKIAVDLNLFLQVWLQDSPSHWVQHRTIDSRTTKQLINFVKEFGDKSLDIFQKGLLYAQTDTHWCMKPERHLGMSNLLSENLIFKFYERYEDQQRRSQESQPISSSSSQERMARNYAKFADELGIGA